MENRRFPRIDICAQQTLLFLSEENELVKNVVLSKNVSATGFCFRSPVEYQPGSTFLVYLAENVLQDIKLNRGSVLKYGNYFLARVIWSRPLQGRSEPYYDIGCAFFDMDEGRGETIDMFTHLVNRHTVDSLAHLVPAPGLSPTRESPKNL